MARLPTEDQLPRTGPFAEVRHGACFYRNALASATDVADWRLEGQAAVSFPAGRLRLASVTPREQGQKANFLFWCPVEFPDGVGIEFDFYPVKEPGLAMFWFCARGRQGEELFDVRLARRSGEYDQYRYGEINAYHAAYFRRGKPGSFQICNLRKSHGFHLVAQGGDPIPSGVYEPPYRIRVLVRDGAVQFEIDELVKQALPQDDTTRQQQGNVMNTHNSPDTGLSRTWRLFTVAGACLFSPAVLAAVPPAPSTTTNTPATAEVIVPAPGEGIQERVTVPSCALCLPRPSKPRSLPNAPSIATDVIAQGAR